jgi:GT2 family glycosyltransferase
MRISDEPIVLPLIASCDGWPWPSDGGYDPDIGRPPYPQEITMITLIIPTRNRAYTLKRVAESFFAQAAVTEIIVVIDAGSDDTEQQLTQLASRYPQIELCILRNKSRMGTPSCRNRGIRAAKNEFILFCDDDQFLEPNYAAVCLRKLSDAGADIAAGRMVYMRPGETMEQAIARFGIGLNDNPPFNRRTLSVNTAARLPADTFVPIAHNAILARTELFRELGYDPGYSKAVGWREEGDLQMHAFLRGYKLLITNDTHTVHLDFETANRGGARTNAFYAVLCVLYNSNHFYSKYAKLYTQRTGQPFSTTAALLRICREQVKIRLVQPMLRTLTPS